MSATNALETSVLQHIFQNAPIPGIGDAAGILPSAVAGSLFISLHIAEPGEDGVQNTNETSYTGYARQAIARTNAGWTVTGNTVTNAQNCAFPSSTGNTQTVTHWGIGTAINGAGVLLFYGSLDSLFVYSTGTFLQFAPGGLLVEAR